MIHAVRLRRFGLSSLALSLATLAVIAYLSYLNWEKFRDSSVETTRTRRVLTLNRDVLDHVREAESAQRGFLLTGRDHYLLPYQHAIVELPGELSELSKLVAASDAQPRRVHDLAALVNDKLAEMRHTIELRQAGESAAALAIVLSDHGRVLMDSIRGISADVQSEEYAKWRASTESLQSHAQQTRILTLVGALLLTVMVGGGFVAVRQSASRRELLIRELDRARHTAEETSTLLRTTLYSIGDAVITTDSHGNVRMMNAVAERLTGYTESEAAGLPIEEVFHIVNEQTRAVVDNPVRRVLREGHTVGLANHTVLISKSGAEVPLDDSGAPIRSAHGVPEGVVLVFRDITERKRVEDELQQSERRFRTVADAAPVMIWSAQPDKRCDYFNKTWLVFTGHQPDQETGDGWVAGIHDEDRERCLQIYSAAFDARVPFSMECRLRRHDGEYHWVFYQGAPRFGSDGEFLGYIGSAVDVEERKSAEEKVRQAAKLESLGVLAGGIAHDFNNLLVGIMGNASLLEDYTEPESPARRLVDNLLQASERAAQLTRQMLAYSGRGRFFVEPLDLSEQVRQITTLVQASIPKNVVLRLALDPHLPSMQADAGQIQQLLMNLVINAAEAVPPHGGRVEVATAVDLLDEALIAECELADDVVPGRYIALTVCDNGVGMDEETRTKIFDPFFTTKFTGRGLGLAATLGIVRGHRGAIHVTSAPGHGTTFRVFFPTGGPHKEAHPPTKEAVVTGSGRVLVVDDEEVVRETAKRALERTGYEVVSACDGDEAIQALSADPCGFDLVLLDMMMPHLSGGDALPRIREVCPGLPVIATSGYNEAEALKRFGNTVDGFIQKPYTVAQLARMVDHLRTARGAKQAAHGNTQGG